MNGVAAGTKTEVTKTSTDAGTINNLVTGTYKAYAEVYDVAGNKTTTTTINIVLDAVAQATSDNLKVASTTWSGTDATVTFSTTTSFSIQYSTDNKTWTTGTSVKVGSGTDIYARLTDGKNAGTSYIATTPNWTGNISFNAN